MHRLVVALTSPSNKSGRLCGCYRNIILRADGSLSLMKVESVGKEHVMTEVMNSLKIGERKNCNLPGVKVDLPVRQQKDIDDLVNFGIP